MAGGETIPGRCGHKLVCDISLLAGDRVLLVKYKETGKYDGQSGWFLPDDYLRRLEHPEDAARRIAKGQAGLEAPKLSLDLVESFEGDDGTWHLIFHYVGRLAQPRTVAPIGNIANAEWFPLDRLPPREALAHHGWAADVLAAVMPRKASPKKLSARPGPSRPLQARP